MRPLRLGMLGLVLRWTSIAVSTVAVATPALAQKKPELPSAKAAGLFRDGQRLFFAKNYAEALPKFEEAVAITGSPNARLYVARCHDQLGHPVRAYDEMRRTLLDATKLAKEDSRYASTQTSATEELVELEKKVGKLIVTVANPAPGQQIRIDGQPLPEDALDGPFTVKPGRHFIVATAPGREPARAEANVGPGTRGWVTLTFAKSETAAPPPPDEGGGMGPLRIAGIAVLGVGVVGLGVFTGAAVAVQDKESTLEESCGTTRCTDPAFDEVVDDGKRLQTVANVALGVGIAASVAGVLMIIFGGEDDAEDVVDEAPAEATWRPWVPSVSSGPGQAEARAPSRGWRDGVTVGVEVTF